MGQKVSPHGFRVGINKDWSSKWYADKKHFATLLAEDKKIRDILKKKLFDAGISKIGIARPNENDIKLDLLVEKPGLVIGTKGAGTNEIKRIMHNLTNKEIDLNIVEAKAPELDAQLVAERIAKDLERRTVFRRAMKSALTATVKAGAKGVKILVSGRLNGAEIARSEKYNEGMIPLHTLRANIDYGFAEARTTYGTLGVKVWINSGEVFEKGLVPVIPEKVRGGDDEPRRRSSGFSGGRSEGGRGEGRKSSGFRKDKRTNLSKAKNPRFKVSNKKEEAAPAPETAPAPAPEVKPEAEAASEQANTGGEN
jgi:small subunit ribosomal protein S3